MWRLFLKEVSSILNIYRQLKELKLTHIFFGNLSVSLILGTGVIYLLWVTSLPHIIPVVLFMMYYFPLARMDMRQYLYRSRSTLEGLPDNQLFDALTLIHFEWKSEFTKHRWLLRLNILALFLYGCGMCVYRFSVLYTMPYGNLIFNIVATVLTGLEVLMNILTSLWLKEEIPLSNKELY